MASSESVVELVLVVEEVVRLLKMFFMLVEFYVVHLSGPRRRQIEERRRYPMIERIPAQLRHMSRLTEICDQKCVEKLRMDRNAFGRLCYLLEHVGGLGDDRHVVVSEQVAIFLSVLAHHTKNSVVKLAFDRSGETVSRHFNQVLNAIMRLYPLLVVEPIPIDEFSTEPNWKWFKGCLGALDGTYVPVRVLLTDKPRYRSRKGDTSVNVLGPESSEFGYVCIK